MAQNKQSGLFPQNNSNKQTQKPAHVTCVIELLNVSCRSELVTMNGLADWGRMTCGGELVMWLVIELLIWHVGVNYSCVMWEWTAHVTCGSELLSWHVGVNYSRDMWEWTTHVTCRSELLTWHVGVNYSCDMGEWTSDVTWGSELVMWRVGMNCSCGLSQWTDHVTYVSEPLL